MSLKGGYQIINLKNKEFNSSTNNSEYYKDIYFNMVNSHAKMIIVSGLNMDGVKYNDYETIFYEVEQPDDNPYFQCIARRIWNTKDYKCITKYINIYSDDRVMCTQEEFIYEILPDGELSLTSTNALQNKVITKNINRIDEVNEQQESKITDLINSDTLINQRISEILEITTTTTEVQLYGSGSYQPLPDDSTTTISSAELSYDALGNFTLRFTVQRSSTANVGFIDVLNGIQLSTHSISGWAILSKTSDGLSPMESMPMQIESNMNGRHGFALKGYYKGESGFTTIDLGTGDNEILIIGKFKIS